jgi:transcriptional regulator with XRE-family HTH domain
MHISYMKLGYNDCSSLGQFILKYLREEDLTLKDLATKSGLTRPGLRSMLEKRGSPTETSLIKLAKGMGVSPRLLLQLKHQNEIENPITPDAIDLFLKAVEELIKVFTEVTKNLPEGKRLDKDEILLLAVKSARLIDY